MVIGGGGKVQVVHNFSEVPVVVREHSINISQQWADTVKPDAEQNVELYDVVVQNHNECCVDVNKFETFLSKSQRKRMRQRNKAAMVDVYNTRSKAGPNGVSH